MNAPFPNAPSARTLASAIPPAEYARLAGLPLERLEADFAAHAAAARDWYARHGDPAWCLAAGDIGLEPDAVLLHGPHGVTRLSGRRLVATVERTSAHALVVAALTAGPELEREAARIFGEHPDAAWFLDRLGAAAVEELARRLRAEGWSGHLAPGWNGWPLEELLDLARFLEASTPAPRPVQLTASGMLEPRNSLLVVYVLTCEDERPDPGSPCTSCSLHACDFRRTR